MLHKQAGGQTMDRNLNTHKPSGSPDPNEREDLLSPDDVDYQPETTQRGVRGGPGDTNDPGSSRNRSAGLERDRQRMSDQDDDNDDDDEDDEDDDFGDLDDDEFDDDEDDEE
jgi:hypothetical protein